MRTEELVGLARYLAEHILVHANLIDDAARALEASADPNSGWQHAIPVRAAEAQRQIAELEDVCKRLTEALKEIENGRRGASGGRVGTLRTGGEPEQRNGQLDRRRTS